MRVKEHMDVQKILPVKANWDETVWKGPIDFIASQAGGKGGPQPAQGPHEVLEIPAQGPHEASATVTPRAGADAPSNGKQGRKHSKEVHEVGCS